MAQPGPDAWPGPGGDGIRQEFSASEAARQAVLGSGVQNVFLDGQRGEPEAALSVAPPIGQVSGGLPLRGRASLLRDLSGPGPGVRVLCGLGGCGKTRVALEVAAEAQRAGTEVWWVSAVERGVLEAGMRAVGRQLGASDAELAHGDAADVVWRRLAARRERWLLVIDNADDPQVLAGAGARVTDGQGWLRPVMTGGPGMVLVTSRDGRPESWGQWCARHRLAVLDQSDAALMLADYAGGDPRLGNEEEARLLAARLGGLPLAVKIAGSYLADAVATPAAYADAGLIRTYQDYQEAVGGPDAAVFAVPAGALTQEHARELVGRTWELTLDLLESRQLPEARIVLRLLACLADAPIPYELLLRPATLSTSPLLPQITGRRLWEVLKALDGFGLIDLGASGDGPRPLPVARLHPLVRDTSIPTPDERLGFLELAARLLERAAATGETGLPEDPPTWPAWQLLAPHVAAVFAALAAEPGCPDDAAKAAAYAAYMAARYQARQGFHAQAEALHRDVLAARLRVLGPDDPYTLGSRYYCIALEVAERGNHEAAEAEYRDVLAATLRVLGPDHSSTLTTRYQIAWEMAERGDHEAAEAEYRNLLAVRLRVQGSDHQDTLTTRHQIAVEMAERGDHEAAEAEYRDVLAVRLRVLGPDHPSTLITRHQIALEMAERGDHEAAEAEFRDVLAAKLRVLGPDHPSTLITRHQIAWEMAERGDYEAAEAEFRDVLAARLRVLGPDHRSTKVTASWIDHLERRRTQ